MSRWVVAFFTLLLPFQFAWSMAAAYCQHETSVVAEAHFGHHPHVHEDAGSKSTGADNSAHADCHVCNAAGAPLLLASLPPAAITAVASRHHLPDAGPLASALSRAPDRPQWLRLV